MATERDVTRIVQSWLRTDEHESADRVLDNVLALLDATPQRRSWWPARRFADMNITAKLATAAAAASGARHAEQIFENVGEGRGEVVAETMMRISTVLECCVAEAVVGGALVPILEDVIGFVDFLEAMLAFGVAGITVGMVLHGELAECRFQIGIARGALHAQRFVVAALPHT